MQHKLLSMLDIAKRQAGRIAGQNLKKLEIKSYIDAEVEKMHSENIMDAKEALSILSDIARGKRGEEVLMMNPVTGESRAGDEES